jgi:hypothetical protein
MRWRPQQDSNLRSRLRRPPTRSGELCGLPARIQLLPPHVVKIIPHFFRIMDRRSHERRFVSPRLRPHATGYLLPLETARDCPHRAGDGPRPVRAGSSLALVS